MVAKLIAPVAEVPELLTIQDPDFSALETAAGRTFSSAQRGQIQQSINNFMTSDHLWRQAKRPRAVRKSLQKLDKKFREPLEMLREPGIVRQLIFLNLPTELGELDLLDRGNWIKPLEVALRPYVAAIRTAIETLPSDRGGRSSSKPALPSFIREMADIFADAGKHPTITYDDLSGEYRPTEFVRFLEAALSLLPTEGRKGLKSLPKIAQNSLKEWKRKKPRKN